MNDKDGLMINQTMKVSAKDSELVAEAVIELVEMYSKPAWRNGDSATASEHKERNDD